MVFCGGFLLALSLAFSGVSALSLDVKGRMTIPTRYRDELLARSQGALALVESDDGCLLLMAQSLWAEKVALFSSDEPKVCRKTLP